MLTLMHDHPSLKLLTRLQLGGIQVQGRNQIKGNFQEIATNKNGNANTATINTE